MAKKPRHQRPPKKKVKREKRNKYPPPIQLPEFLGLRPKPERRKLEVVNEPEPDPSDFE